MRKLLLTSVCTMAMTTASFANFADEITPDEIRHRLTELLQLHGMNKAGIQAVEVDGERVIARGLSAENESLGLSIIAREIWFEGINDEDGESTWLGFDQLAAKEVELSYKGHTLTLDNPHFSKIAFLNLNEYQEGNEGVDGKFSAVKFSKFNPSKTTLTMGTHPVAVIYEAEVTALDWLPEPNWPRVGDFKLTGAFNAPAIGNHIGFNVPGFLADGTSFELSGKEVVDNRIGIGSFNVSLSTSNAGAAVAKLSLTNLRKGFFDAVAAYTSSTDGEVTSLAPALDEARISEMSVAFSSLGWVGDSLGGIPAFSGSTSILGSNSLFTEMATHIMAENRSGTVTVRPKGKVSLSDIIQSENYQDVIEVNFNYQ